jgi:PPP family 3-phenylpropionic acid transporter
MRQLKAQYFLGYAVMGSVFPLLAEYLQSTKGLSKSEIGVALALVSSSHLVSPVLLTLLADTRWDARRILAAAFAVAATAFAVLAQASGLAAVLACVTVFGLSLVATNPLQDSFYFAAARRAEAEGTAFQPYPFVRAWGTAGFVLPSVILFVLFRLGAPGDAIAWCAVAFSALAIVNSFRIPGVARAVSSDGPARRLPTAEAARRLLSGGTAWFCLALLCAHAASSIYFPFFSIYAREVAGIDRSWVALILNYGVLLEIGFTLATPWLVGRFGVRKLMVAGFLTMSGRMLLLAFVHHPVVIVLAQTLHGMEIVALYILPVIYINRLAADHFRASIQGVYAMLVVGVAKCAVFPVAGRLAEAGLPVLYLWGGLLGLVAAALSGAFVRPYRELGGETPPSSHQDSPKTPALPNVPAPPTAPSDARS